MAILQNLRTTQYRHLRLIFWFLAARIRNAGTLVSHYANPRYVCRRGKWRENESKGNSAKRRNRCTLCWPTGGPRNERDATSCHASNKCAYIELNSWRKSQGGEKLQLKATRRILEREYPQIAEAPVHQRKRVHRVAEQDRERVRVCVKVRERVLRASSCAPVWCAWLCVRIDGWGNAWCTLETPCFTADRVAAPGFIYTSRVPSYIRTSLCTAASRSDKHPARCANYRLYLWTSEQPFDSDN